MTDLEILSAIRNEFQKLYTLTYLQHKDVLTEEEAAFWTGKKVSTIRSMACRKEIAVCKPGGEKGTSDSYFLKSDLNEYMSRNRKRSLAEINTAASTYNFKRKAS